MQYRPVCSSPFLNDEKVPNVELQISSRPGKAEMSLRIPPPQKHSSI